MELPKELECPVWQNEDDIFNFYNQIIEAQTNTIEEYPEYPFLGACYTRRGMAYYYTGEYGLAIDDFEAAKLTVDYADKVQQLNEFVGRCYAAMEG